MEKMKVIKKVKINKKNVVLLFQNKDKLELASEVLANFYLYDGKTLTNKEYQSIVEFNDSIKLWKYALSLIKRGHYSEWKMREKLYAKEADKKQVDNIISLLKKVDLLNDAALAFDLYEYGNERNLGKNKIIFDLSQKGIFEKEINKLSFSSSLEKKKALHNIPKLEKRYEKYSYQEKKAHVYRALIGLGFDSDIATSALSALKPMNEKSEKEKLLKDFDKTYEKYVRKYEGKELKEKVFVALRNKGYKYSEIARLWEANTHENDFGIC